MHHFRFKISEVLAYFKNQGYKVYRRGRTVGYNSKRKTRNTEGKLEYKYNVLFYLKKSVEIPARKFFYLTNTEMDLLAKEAGIAINIL